jgi:carbamoyltransferase
LALDGRGDNNVRVRVIRLGENHEADNLYHSTGFAVGKFFSRVGAYLGLEGQVVDRAGKVAGAQAFGHFDVEFADALASDDPETLPRRLLDEIPWRGLIPAGDPSFFSVENPSFLSWLTTCHKILERSVLRFIAERTGSARLHCYAGGVAQNSVFNEAFCRTHPNLLIPPHCYDGGLSIGCIEFLCRLLNMPFPAWPAFPFAQDDEDVGYAGSDNLEKVVDLLISGKVVGWMQGHGEIGPRALGHRSILMDPRRADAKDLLNERVKKREFWRPYAGSVLEEYASSWFATSVPSPHMLRAIATLKPRWGEIPAVVHFDGTCRIQTVSSDLPELASYRQLIKRFFDRTGVPLILNSSLNGGGEPIFGWAGQGLDMFRSGRLDALCIGDVLHLR